MVTTKDFSTDGRLKFVILLTFSCPSAPFSTRKRDQLRKFHSTGVAAFDEMLP